jgi:hypothetical protein
MTRRARHIIGDYFEFSAPEDWRLLRTRMPSGVAVVAPGGVMLNVVGVPAPRSFEAAAALTLFERDYAGLARQFARATVGDREALEAVFEPIDDGITRCFIFTWDAEREVGVAVSFHGPHADVARIREEVAPLVESIRFLGGGFDRDKPAWRLGPDVEEKFAQLVTFREDARGEPVVRALVPMGFTEVAAPQPSSLALTIGGAGRVVCFRATYAGDRSPLAALSAIAHAKLEPGETFDAPEYRHGRGYLLICADDVDADPLLETILESVELPGYDPAAVARREIAARHPGLLFADVDGEVFYHQADQPGFKGRVFLGNLENATTLAVASPVTGARCYYDMVSVFVPAPRAGWRPSRSRVFPFVCLEDGIPGRADGPVLVSELEGDLRAVFVADDEGRACALTDKDRETLELDDDELIALTWLNLQAQMTRKPPRLVGEHANAAGGFIFHDRSYAAGSLLRPFDLHDLYRQVLGDVFFVAAPGAHDLILFRRGTEGFLNWMREIVATHAEISPHPLPPTIYELSASGLRPF